MIHQPSAVVHREKTGVPHIKGGMILVLVTVVWSGILSCYSLPDYRADLVTRLRILGIRSEPLEAPVGTTVTLTTLVADPKGNGRTLFFVWSGCSPTTGGGFTCEAADDPSKALIGPAVGFTLPTLSPGATMTEVGLVVTLGTINSEFEEGYKRIFVSDSPTPNHNPHVQEVFVGGNPISAETHTGGSPVTITASVTPGSAEVINGIQEKMFWSWFITSGSMKDEITVGGETENVWTAGTEGGALVTATTLYVVLRDGLGGIDWTSTVLLVP